MTGEASSESASGLPDRLWTLSTLLMTLVAPRSHQIVLEAFGDAQTRTDYALLAGLDEYGPLSQAALARRVGFDRSDLVAPLRDLEARGLAIRRPDPADRRRHAVTITPQGDRRLRDLDAAAAKAQADFLGPLTPDQQRQFLGHLQQLLLHHTDFTPPDS